MAINYYSVCNDLESSGWTLLSESYKNLKTPMQMCCPNGHEIEDTYEHWRKYKLCEQCLAGEIRLAKKGDFPAKSEGTTRVLALDAATKISGYAIFDDDTLIAYGTHAAPNSETTERINEIKHWINSMVAAWQPDMVGMEHIQLQTFGKNPQVELYRVLANLQGVTADTLFENGVQRELAYATSWRKELGITGNGRVAEKKAAQTKVFEWYGLQVSEDEADAICIGKYFIKKLLEGKGE